MSLYLSGGGPQGGGSCTDPTISSTLGNVADQSGAYAPTLTHDGASVATTATNTSTGSVTVTDSTTTTPSVPEPAAGSATLVTHTTTASDGLTHSISFVVAKAAASDGPTVIFSSANVDDYDFTTTGGTGGSGGAGTHTLSDGTVVTIDETGTGPTTCEFSGGKLLVGGGDASNFYNLMFDLGASTQFSTVFFRAVALATADVTASGTLFKFAESSTAWGNLADDLSVLALGGTASSQTIRFRFANSSTNFNNFLDVGSMDLSSGEAVEIYMDSSNPGASVGVEAGATVPSWKTPALANMQSDTRATVPSHRRYFYIRAKEQDLSLDFTLSHNR